jgi:acetylornithine deacetylase/succinyl-diaminopimelate desuccinylase-like protein
VGVVLVFFSIVLVAVPVPSSTDPVDAGRHFREVNVSRILHEFVEILAIPNVARDSSNIRKNALWIADRLSRRGVDARVWSLPEAPPVVFGELRAPGVTRTLGIYIHYDGQPVDRSEWRHPPWQPTLYTGPIEEGGEARPMPRPGEFVDPESRLYARSAGDDKAPLVAVLAALDGLAAAGLEPTVNLKLLLEGEEEAGSGHLGAYFDRYREDLVVDLWLICDGPVHQSRRPQLVFGVRGYTGLDITVYGATHYLHSGHYGNWAPNPALVLASLLASMKDPEGRVYIRDFYATTAPITEKERSALAALPQYDDHMRRELALHSTEADNASLAERLLLPSLNIRGLASGRVGASARNVIPPQATASLDIRLASGNDPIAMLDLVESHIRKEGFQIVRDDPDRETRLAHPRIAKVTRRPGYRAVRTPLDSSAVRPIIEAVTRAAGESPLLVPTMGGSLPLYLFTEKLSSPLVILPIANHDNNQHAPNENLRLANLWYGIDLMTALFTIE